VSGDATSYNPLTLYTPLRGKKDVTPDTFVSKSPSPPPGFTLNSSQLTLS